MSPAALALSAALAVALDGPGNDNRGSSEGVSGGRFTGMKRLRKRYGRAAPLMGYRFWIFAGRRPVAGFTTRSAAERQVSDVPARTRPKLRIVDTSGAP